MIKQREHLKSLEDKVTKSQLRKRINESNDES